MGTPGRPSIVQRLSMLPTMLPPRAREAVSVGGRILVALSWCGAALALFVAFAVLHMRLETGKRATIEIAQALLDDAIRGHIRIGEVATLEPERLVLRNVVITDPQGRVVIQADRVTADLDPWRLLSGEIRIERVAVHRPRVELFPCDREYVSLLDTFRPRTPPRAGRPTPDIVLAEIHLDHASVAGTLPGLFDLDVRRISLGGAFRFEDEVPILDVSWLRGEVRAPVATPVDLQGRLHLAAAGPRGPGGVHGNAKTTWGRSSVSTTFGVRADRIRVHVSTDGVHPEDVRALGVEYPLDGLVRGRVAVDGPPERLGAVALLRLEAGRIRASGTFTFGPPPAYQLDVGAEGIDLARILPDVAPPTTLGFAGHVEGHGLTKGTLDTRVVGRFEPGIVDDYPTPGGPFDVRFDGEGVEIVRFEPTAPGLGGNVHGRVGYDGVIDTRGELHAHRLALIHGLRRVGGSASARFRFRRGVEGRLAIDLDAAGRGLEFGPVRFGEADIGAHVTADGPAIAGRVDARGTGLVFSGVTLGAATVSARGDRRTVRLSLHSVDPERRESVLTAVVHPDAEGFRAEVTELRAGFVGEPLRGTLRQLDYRRQRVKIEDLVLVRGDARLTATGEYDVARRRVHGVVAANNLDLAELKRFVGDDGRAIEGRMGIRLAVDGPIARPDFQLSADVRGGRYGDLRPVDLAMQADCRDRMLSIDAGLSIGGAEALHVAGTTPFDLALAGTGRFLGPGERDLDIELTSLDLDRFGFLLFEPGRPRPVQAVLSGTVHLGRTWADPEMQISLRAERARVGPLEDLVVTVEASHAQDRTRFHLNARRAGQLALDAEGTHDLDLGLAPGRAPPTLTAALVAPLAARVSVGPLDWSSLPTTLQTTPKIDARVVLAGDVGGSLKKPTFQGEVDVRRVEGESLPWSGELGGRFDLGYSDDTLRAEGDLTDGRSIIAEVEARLGIDLLRAARGDPELGDLSITATFEDVAVSRIRWFEGKPVEGTMRGRVEVATLAGAASLHGEVESHGLRVGEETIPIFSARVDYSGQLLTVAAAAQQYGGGRIDARATWRLPWTGEAGTTLDALSWPMSGDLTAERFSISSILPSLPMVAALDGRLDGHLSIVRFQDAPQVNGQLALTNGIFEVAGFGQRLTSIEARLAFQGTRFTIQTLRFKDRNGTVEAVAPSASRPAGEGTLENLVPKTFGLSLAASRFPIVREGVPLARVTARIQVAGTVRGRTVEMTARLRGAKVLLPDRPSRDLQSLDDHSDIVIVTREPPAPIGGPPVVFLVHVRLENEMWITRSDMRLAFVGDVDLRYPWGGNLVLGGMVELTRGEAEAYGRRFRIETGVVRFEPTERLDPVLDVRARWEHPQAVVLLRVAGRLSRPRITFSSDPSLSQDQIVTLLVLGRTETRENEQSAVNDTAARQTGALLQGIGAALAQESVREALPDVVPIVAIEPGEEGLADARYRAGSQVADRLYVEGSYSGADSTNSGENRSEVRIEYRLSRRWSVESHAGDENSGADLLWSYSY